MANVEREKLHIGTYDKRKDSKHEVGKNVLRDGMLVLTKAVQVNCYLINPCGGRSGEWKVKLMGMEFRIINLVC